MNSYKKPERIEIVYFSGTGSTRQVADEFAVQLKGHGISVGFSELKQSNTLLKALKCRDTDMLILIYPVYALNAPKPIHQFITGLSKTKSCTAAVFSVSGGGEISPNTACRLHCIHRLEKKGYRVTYEKMIVMPSNFAMATPDELAIRLLQVLPSKVELICRDLLRGKIRRPKPILFDQFLSVVGELGRTKISSWIFGKHIKANKNCNGCGLCKANCPMGNIKLINRKPVFHSRCALCLKCIYRCPKGALSPGIGKFIILKDGYPLKKWENQMNDKLPAIDYNSYGYAFSGIVKYLKEDEKR